MSMRKDVETIVDLLSVIHEDLYASMDGLEEILVHARSHAMTAEQLPFRVAFLLQRCDRAESHIAKIDAMLVRTRKSAEGFTDTVKPKPLLLELGAIASGSGRYAEPRGGVIPTATGASLNTASRWINSVSAAVSGLSGHYKLSGAAKAAEKSAETTGSWSPAESVAEAVVALPALHPGWYVESADELLATLAKLPQEIEEPKKVSDREASCLRLYEHAKGYLEQRTTTHVSQDMIYECVKSNLDGEFDRVELGISKNFKVGKKDAFLKARKRAKP